MRVHITNLLPRLIRKAAQSPCRHKVVAVGFNSHGTVIAMRTNKFRFLHVGGGWHAEELLIYSTPKSLVRILIARVRGNRLLPIDACGRCSRLAARRGVIIERAIY